MSTNNINNNNTNETNSTEGSVNWTTVITSTLIGIVTAVGKWIYGKVKCFFQCWLKSFVVYGHLKKLANNQDVVVDRSIVYSCLCRVNCCATTTAIANATAAINKMATTYMDELYNMDVNNISAYLEKCTANITSKANAFSDEYSDCHTLLEFMKSCGLQDEEDSSHDHVCSKFYASLSSYCDSIEWLVELGNIRIKNLTEHAREVGVCIDAQNDSDISAN